LLRRKCANLLASEARLQELRSLFLTLGGALLGATAIVSSLVLFSMQVNVERMPHGLFRRLSADRRLLTAFALAFLLAVLVATLSLVSDARLIGAATFGAFWATALILILFLYGYQRALVLINPIRQLNMVVASTRREFRAWARRAKRAAPLFADPDPSGGVRNDPSQPKLDLARAACGSINSALQVGDYIRKRGISTFCSGQSHVHERLRTHLACRKATIRW
jgi:hypothetical protein